MINEYKRVLLVMGFVFFQELEIHQNKGFIDKDVLLLTLEDPKARVGSGGATVNALLVVTEHLSAKAGYEVSFYSCTMYYTILENNNIVFSDLFQRAFSQWNCKNCLAKVR